MLIYTMEHLLVVCLIMPVHFVADEDTQLLKLKENRADKYATKCQIKWLQSAKTPRMCWAYILPLVPNLSRFGKFKYIVFTMHLDIHYFRYIVKSMHQVCLNDQYSTFYSLMVWLVNGQCICIFVRVLCAIDHLIFYKYISTVTITNKWKLQCIFSEQLS